MRRVLTALMLLLAASPVQAATQDTLRLSLDDALGMARDRGAEMRVARAGVNVAEGQVKEAAAEALPQITGSLTYNRKFDSVFRGAAEDTTLGGLADLFANSPFAARHTWTAEVTARQTLWSTGRVGAGLAGARAFRNAARAGHDEAGAAVTLAVHEAYFGAVYAREVLTIAEQALAQSRAHLDQVRLWHAQGARSEYDLLQAQVDAATQEPVVVEARNTHALALLALKRQLTLPPEQAVALTTALAFDGARVPVPASEPTDALGRPQVRGAEAMVQARRQALRAERAQRWPTLAAQATVSHAAFPADGSPEREEFTRAIDGAIVLEWPLFQGFRTFGSVQRARAELSRAEAERDQVRDLATLELESARQDVRRSLATLAARRGTVRLAARAHELAGIRFRNGLSTALEVSDARLKQQTAEVQAVAALKDHRLALARLERAAGHPLKLTTVAIDDLTPEEVTR